MKHEALIRMAKGIGLSLVSLLVLSGCLTIRTLDQPTTARTGDVIETSIVAYSTFSNFGIGAYSPYVGIHLPEGWSVVTPVTYTGFYTGTLTYNADLAAEMETLSSKPGYYWWVGKGDAHDPVIIAQRSNGTIHIQTNHRPGVYYLDYITADNGLIFGGLSHGDLHSNIPITVTDSYGAGWNPFAIGPIWTSPGHTFTVSERLINLGSQVDVFQLTGDWNATFYSGTTPITQTPPISPYATIPLSITLLVPDGAGITEDWVTPYITATSILSPGKSAYASFDVRVGEVLLIDNDSNTPDVRNIYTETLDALGIHYAIWDMSTLGKAPNLNTLEQFDA
ncbi:MAG: hypothetical protein JW981_04985, partial [Anaerolineae bacterium]|nr:hypothetical protein [Anaerolineae bacterium]